MKTSIVLFVFICTLNMYAQVGIGTTSPDPSSALDVSSTIKGLLPPRMTDSERNSIVSPVAGLQIWCTNCGVHGQLQVYNGFAWTNILGGPSAGIPAIGDVEGGGKVAYILQAGDPGYVAGENHGLIATEIEQGPNGAYKWGCSGTSIPGADGTALGTGNQNTMDIVNGCATADIAARICNDLVLEGYIDWYLPGKDELYKLYLNRTLIGGFTDNVYWSSSEIGSTSAWSLNFVNGGQASNSKINNFYVRAVRAF